MNKQNNNPLFEFILRLGDDLLINGHRLSEWCGHAPILEEDVALSNIALDSIGQASMLLSLAAEVENAGQTEDSLAYLREAGMFRNILLVELPNHDFAFTIARQFLFDSFNILFYKLLKGSSFELLSAIAEKALKEMQYHFRHSKEWVLRLGDGTTESHDRLQSAVDDMWRYTDELFFVDNINRQLMEENIAPNISLLKNEWNDMVLKIFNGVTITIPENKEYVFSSGRQGFHTEHLGHLLAEMQITSRSFPGVKW